MCTCGVVDNPYCKHSLIPVPVYVWELKLVIMESVTLALDVDCVLNIGGARLLLLISLDVPIRIPVASL